jgi:hypothetical protein
MASVDPNNPGRSLVLYPNRDTEPEHERLVHLELARRLAALQGMAFAGVFDPAVSYGIAPYLVPSATLIGLDLARQLGLRGEQDLFGGVAPHPFVPTKAISHPLLNASAYAPPGWSYRFNVQVANAVLDGFTAFTLEDARAAGLQLLAEGPLRIKPVCATGGRDQTVVQDAAGLDACLAALDPAQLAVYGLVLEQDLADVTTFSVGQVRVAGLVVSYYGTQRLTPDNNGEQVYGGSDLLLARGDFNELLKLELPEMAQLAVLQARLYDLAAMHCYRGLYASRRNYDILQGTDMRGLRRSGVLEQSWRIGGASSAEVLALERFAAEPQLRSLRARSVELFGKQQQVPPGAILMYRGSDAQIGFVSKFAMVEAHDQQ